MGFRDRVREKLSLRGRSGSKNPPQPPDQAANSTSIPDAPVPTLDQDHSDRSPQDARNALSNKPTKPNITTEPKSLWDLAWEKFKAEHAEEAETFRERIAESPDLLSADESVQQKNATGEQIASSVSAAYEKHKADHETSYRVKETVTSILSLLRKGNEVIGSAVSFNPIAASVWTGVSLVIPVLLQPGEQNEVALGTLRQSIELMQCYQSYEAILQEESGSAAEHAARDKIVALYSIILLFQSQLVEHRSHGGVRRLYNSIVNDWSDFAAKMTSIDTAFRNQMEALRNQWQREEQINRRTREDRRERNEIIEDLSVDFRPPKGRRLPGTCEWFLRRLEFLNWKLKSAGLLWVTADPGCGKSVLINYLVDNKVELLTSRKRVCIVAHFFFSGGQTYSNASMAICSLLCQILLRWPQGVKVVQDFCNTNGLSTRTLKSAAVDDVWELFCHVVEEARPTHEIICVLDALDECDSSSISELLQLLDELYGRQVDDMPPLRFLVTSRPYEELRRGLRRIVKISPNVQIDATEEQDTIKAEIDLVIAQKVEDLAEDKELDAPSKASLLQALRSAEHRTYLWLHLVLQRFEDEWIHAGQDIGSFVDALPQSVEEEYEKILQRMKPSYRQEARAVFEIMLVAFRPLTASQVYHAARINASTKTVGQLSSGTSRPSSAIIRELCGLFVVIDKKDRLFFIHETARAFLLQQNHHLREPSMAEETHDASWRHQLSLPSCHMRLAEACLRYFDLPEVQSWVIEHIVKAWDPDNNIFTRHATGGYELSSISGDGEGKEDRMEEIPLLAYAVSCLDHLHPRYLQESLSRQVYELFMHVGNRDSGIGLCPYWYRGDIALIPSGPRLALPLAAATGLTNILTTALRQGEDLYPLIALTGSTLPKRKPSGLAEVQVSSPGEPPTHYERTITWGRLTIEKLSTPIALAIFNDQKDVVSLLLEPAVLAQNHAIFDNPADYAGRNPLCLAASVSLSMLECLARRPQFSANLADKDARPLLCSAVESNDPSVIRKVVDMGADLSALDFNGKTPMHLAVNAPYWVDHEKHADLLETLLSLRLEWLDQADYNGGSPLFYSLYSPFRFTLDWLSKHEAKLTAKSGNQRNFLHALSFQYFYRFVGGQLLEKIIPCWAKHPDFTEFANARDEAGDTPLTLAIQRNERLVDVLARLPEVRIDVPGKGDLLPLEMVKQYHSDPSNIFNYKTLVKILETRSTAELQTNSRSNILHDTSSSEMSSDWSSERQSIDSDHTRSITFEEHVRESLLSHLVSESSAHSIQSGSWRSELSIELIDRRWTT